MLMAASASQTPPCPKEVHWLFIPNVEALQKDPVSTMAGMAFLAYPDVVARWTSDQVGGSPQVLQLSSLVQKACVDI